MVIDINDELTRTIILGVVSGILTTAVLWLIYQVYQHVLRPWLQSLRYHGVIIEGRWSASHTENEQRWEMQLYLNQSGHRVDGAFSAKSMAGERIYSNAYRVHGTIDDNFVVLTYEPASRRRLGKGAFVLRLKNGGKGMTGSVAFVNEGNFNSVIALNSVSFNQE